MEINVVNENKKRIGQFTIEEAQAVFFDNKALREPAYKLYRLDGGDNRFYYHINELNQVTYFMSATSFVSKTLASDFSFLMDWAVRLEREDKSYKYERNASACYGTLMHIEAEKLIVNKQYDLDLVPEVVDAYTLENGYREFMGAWVRRLQKDMVSLMAFVQRHKVEPLAIEVMLGSKDLRLAGAVDLLCEMSIYETVEVDSGEVYKTGKRKGEPKMVKQEQEQRVTAIVDFKSGENFYEGHIVQLAVYKRLVEENFDIKVDRLFNWSPKKWRSQPDFNLKDQTDDKSVAKLPHLIELMRIDYPNLAPSKPAEFEGMLTLDSDVTSHYTKESVDEMLARLSAKPQDD